jgi:hypothetical protein
MNHIKLFEDFKILKENPKWFYLVLRFEKAWDSLLKMEFDGVIGVSDNPNIINSWFDIRDTLLIMNGEEFLKLNPNVHKVDYDNPNQLVSNNFKLLNRLLQNSEEREDFYDVCQKVFSNTQKIKTSNKNYDVIQDTSYFLNHNVYKFENLVEKAVKSGKVINNVWDFVNVLWSGFPEIIEYYNNNYSWAKKYKIKDFDKNVLYYVIQHGILNLSNTWKKEGEWIIKKDKISGKRNFKVPVKSKLYFKIDVTDPDELVRLSKTYGSTRGLSKDNLKLATDLIDTYKLDTLYDIEFIEGHMKTFDIWKDEPIPDTIPYAKLMKDIKGFKTMKKKPVKRIIKKVA